MRRILILGATGGLGQALCTAFSKDQVQLGLHCFKNQEKGKKRAKALNTAGCKTLLFSVDLCNSDAVQEMFQTLFSHWEGIDLLINAAGITQNRLLQQVTSSEWDHLIRLNLSGAFYCLREAGRIMKKQKKGHIINIASHAALTGRIGQAAYTASKQGLIALSQTAAKEWGEDGIQVNTICPGFLQTAMTATLNPEQTDRLIEKNLLGRPSTLEEVAGFIYRLSKMQHVSGQTFNLDSRIG